MSNIKAKNNILTKEELKTLYKRYSAAYDDKKRRLRNRGYIDKMYSDKLTEIGFDRLYTAAGNTMDLKKMTFASNKAKSSAIIDMIVERQATEFSHAQAEAFQKAYEKRENKPISIKDVYRYGPQYVNDLNDKLKKDGINDGNERKRIIAMTFFGSP